MLAGQTHASRTLQPLRSVSRLASEHSFGSQRRDLLRPQAEQLCHDLIGVGANGWSGPAYLTGVFGHMGHDARVKDATKSRIIHFPDHAAMTELRIRRTFGRRVDQRLASGDITGAPQR